ncbi:amidase [Catalinimonas niigatensis]|uniref:amidase n=1 Tax=Catalinimonas niigatensis TaxID=1397264 RepID=UPI002665323D|nr:amidase [Catalinimonas niigatensis]WPP49270.1 amidase [Catalinimonas niigatensis]
MKYILTIFLTALITAAACYFWLRPRPSEKISKADIQAAQKLIAMDFEEWEIDTMMKDLNGNAENYAFMHQYQLKNEVPPALVFNPTPQGFSPDSILKKNQWNIPDDVALPINQEELAFYSILELASLLKNQKITSTELTRLYIDRIKRYDDTLQSIITITEALALQQAAQADEEISQGRYRGPLHGIPYGVKDLLAVEGYKTTWGSNTHKDQMLDQTATVVQKLEEAGAVLIAKTTSGALARGDVWFGGTTKNPWDTKQGASGSSAGSASATVAGLLGFSIGTETMGSIVSPSTRCGASGLRPTYGRVSRNGAMTLSWSLDKVGPICRTAEDCAIVFDAIHGADAADKTTRTLAFNYDGKIDFSQIKFGFLEEYFEKDTINLNNDATLEKLRALGADMQAVSMPDSTTLPVKVLSLIMYAEAGAAFDDLTRYNLDDSMVKQDEGARPNALRQSRFIPAVEYIMANRYRYQLIQEMQALMEEVDVIVAPTQGFRQLLITNMTGHPVVVVPNGFDDKGRPQSITFVGKLYDEATILEVAKAFQEATEHEEQHPAFFFPDAPTALQADVQ